MRPKKWLIIAGLALGLLTVAAHGDTVYVATSSLASSIVKITADGTISTFASTNFGSLGNNGWSLGSGLAIDAGGNLYTGGDTLVWDPGGYGGFPAIFKITPNGNVSTFAGNSVSGIGFAFDGAGNLCVADIDHNAITKIAPDGTLSTFATISRPWCIALDPAGDLYVGDYDNSIITEIAPTGGVIRTFDSGVPYPPYGLALDASGNLYVADGVSTVNKVTPGGAVSTFASGLEGPGGLAFGSDGCLYVPEDSDGTISKITPGGTVSTFVSGLGGPTFIAIQTPEPAALALLSLGVAGLFARRRRR